VADPSARDARTLRRVLASPADFLL
jgi:hypothetical protein